MTEAEKTDAEPVLNDDWMVRRCFVYEEEYKDCTSWRSRFNQLFIFGKTIDCGQWSRDASNCYKFIDKQDLKAGQELIDSEKQRRKDRLSAHLRNDTWNKRIRPPENWDAPLPEEMQKEYEGTYLYVKSKELKGEIPQTFDPEFKCTIL